MSSIPNELKITINTSIPGFQTIRYKPSMTIPGDNSNSVQFNPLVKLKKSVINSLPNTIQVKEFFNRGLFQSLINAHGLVRANNLIEATNEGIVDNNIKITLETLFPTNGILYVANQPYAIADVLWTKGDWQIDKKIRQIPQINLSSVNNPYLFTQLAKEQQINGENELKSLPTQVIYGPNFTPPVTPPIPFGSSSTALVKSPLTPPSATTSTATYPQLPAPQGASTTTYPQLPAPPTPPATTYPQLPAPPTPSTKTYPQLPAPPVSNTTTYPQLPAPPAKINDDNIAPTFSLKLDVSTVPTNYFRNYFISDNYYFMVNYIYQNMNKNAQSTINTILTNTTSVNVKESNNISKKAYNITVKNTRIYKNAGGGDCFFIAVAQAINYHNLNSLDTSNKIYYNSYGKGNMIFTQQILRKIVSSFILNLNANVFNDLLTTSKANVIIMNEEFQNLKNNIPLDMPLDEKMATLSNYLDYLYTGFDSFLVMKPITITSDDVNNSNFMPFKLITDKNDIKKYIESSNYWANYIAIDAINADLGLNIIAIEKTSDNKLRVPYINTNYNSNRYMFLYYANKHYEVISFEFIKPTIKKKPKLTVKNIKRTVVIFNKNDNIFPPFWLIFLIFGTFYINLRDDIDKNNLKLLPFIFKELDSTFNNIINLSDSNEKKKFLNLFNTYFNPSILTSSGVSQPQQRVTFTSGGANSSNNITTAIPIGSNYLNPYFTSSRQIPVNSNNNNNNFNFNKTLIDEPISNISYYITIDIELKKGTSLSTMDMVNLKCNQQLNKIRKNYSDLRGLKYVIPPVYDNLPSTDRKNDKNQNTTKKQQPMSKNNFNRNISTRKNKY